MTLKKIFEKKIIRKIKITNDIILYKKKISKQKCNEIDGKNFSVILNKSFIKM